MANKGKATIVVIDKHHNNTMKPFQIPNSILLHRKKYLSGIIGLFVLLIVVIVFLSNHILSSNPIVQKTIIVKNQAIEINHDAKLDTSLLKSKFAAIEKKLTKINQFLKSKGIQPLFNKSNSKSQERATWAQLTKSVDHKLEKTSNALAKIPLGAPINGKVTSPFGGRSNPFNGHGSERHKGLDFSGNRGDLVKSTAGGNIKFAGKQNGYGNVIIVNHGNGFETKYAHLSKILVKSGESIQPGETIGKVGSTGRSTGPHLHYEVLKNGQQINPKGFLTLE